jgi:uncharacterized protein with PIN domain
VIVFLDTSSLVKLYVDEAGSDEVRQGLSDATSVAISAIAYPEARATFARRHRERIVTSAVHRLIVRDFDLDWSTYLVIEPTMAMFRQAGELAERYEVRGFDSVHLASYLSLAGAAGASSTRFSSFDTRLNRAAAKAVKVLSR